MDEAPIRAGSECAMICRRTTRPTAEAVLERMARNAVNEDKSCRLIRLVGLGPTCAWWARNFS